MKIKGLIIDLDGVLTKDKSLTPFNDAGEFIQFLRNKNIKFKIATNNSLYSPRNLINRLNNKGINIKDDEIITPLYVAPIYMKEKSFKDIFVIGSKELESYIKESGFNIKKSVNIDAVLIGQDKEFNFEKMKIATTSIKENNAKILALNGNLITKDDDNLVFPGVGSIANMFAYATKKDWIHFGKNSSQYNRELFKYFENIDKSNLAILSDDLFTDLKPMKKLGLKTIFITTGKYKTSDITADSKPDLIVNSLSELMKLIE